MPRIGDLIKGKELGFTCDKNRTYMWIACPNCKQERWVRRDNVLVGKQRLCKQCSGREKMKRLGNPCRGLFGVTHPRWKGGKYRSSGYILLKLTPDDFFYPMTNASALVFEHRLIIAKQIKRCLFPWEVVHHKNGIRDDNRLENLELLSDKRWHLVDSKTKSYIAGLEKKVRELELKLTCLGTTH